MPEINVELMRLGIAGLRSGRFKKGVGALHRIIGGPEPGPDDTYCCIGVLSVIAAENGCPVHREIVENSFSGGGREQFGGQYNEFFSQEVMNCYGLDSIDPELITARGTRVTASNWNDQGDGERPPEEDFNAIADGFERTFLTPQTASSDS